MRKRKSEIKQEKTLTKFVAFSLCSVIIFTIISQIIFVQLGLEYTTLTTCFFSVFGGEVLSCALIKIFKLKGEEKKDAGICNTADDNGNNDFSDNSSDEEAVG